MLRGSCIAPRLRRVACRSIGEAVDPLKIIGEPLDRAFDGIYARGEAGSALAAEVRQARALYAEACVDGGEASLELDDALFERRRAQRFLRIRERENGESGEQRPRNVG